MRCHMASSRYAYFPNQGRAKFAIAMLGIAALLDAAHAVLYGVLLSVWGQIEDTEPYEAAENAIALADLATLILCAIAFLLWFHRAYGNAHAVGLRPRFGQGWALGGWFVPFLNLVRPFNIAGDMWRHAGRDRTGSFGIVGLWWTFWIVTGPLARIGAMQTAGRDPDKVQWGIKLLLAADLTGIAAAFLAIVMVRRLTRAQEAMRSLQQAEVFA